MKTIIAFAGSNHTRSINQSLVEYASRQIEGNSVKILNLRDVDVPIYSIDRERNQGIPPEILRLKSMFHNADGFLIASPEHNGSIPAFFKNIIDWLSRIDQNIFEDKPVVLLSASPGAKGGSTNIQHLKMLMPYWGAQILGSFSLGSYESFLTAGKLELSEGKVKELKQLVCQLSQNLEYGELKLAC